jgi:hypothetical protein
MSLQENTIQDNEEDYFGDSDLEEQTEDSLMDDEFVNDERDSTDDWIEVHETPEMSALRLKMEQAQILLKALMESVDKPAPVVETWKNVASIGLWTRHVCTCGQHTQVFEGFFIKREHKRAKAIELIRGHDTNLPETHQFIVVDTEACEFCQPQHEILPFEGLTINLLK